MVECQLLALTRLNRITAAHNFGRFCPRPTLDRNRLPLETEENPTNCAYPNVNVSVDKQHYQTAGISTPQQIPDALGMKTAITLFVIAGRVHRLN